MRELKLTYGIIRVAVYESHSTIKLYFYADNYNHNRVDKCWTFISDEMKDYSYMQNIEDIFDTIQSDIKLTADDVLNIQRIIHTWVDCNSAKGGNDND